MTYTIQQIGEIIKEPRNKDLIAYGVASYEKAMLHLRGAGMRAALERIDHFENDAIHPVRQRYALSNVDLFNRLLQEEEQVFTTVGGQITIGSPVTTNEDVSRYTVELGNHMPLRKWMQRVGYDAYNADPMGLLFIEHDGETPMVTYKCIKSIHDYHNEGRHLDYVCFRIDERDYNQYSIGGITFEMQSKNTYYRFIDESQDTVVLYDNGQAIQVNTVPNVFGRVPGFIISDIVDFTNHNRFMSRLYPIIELADCFLKDRSVEQLQKNYHGFAKAVEPFLQCNTCQGEGNKGGIACPDCSTPGASVGSGFKRQTKVSDVSRFPLEMLKEISFDFKKIFGYVTPDIASMEYQNKALYALEALMYRTHWGSVTPAKAEFNGTQQIADTATKVLQDTQPKRSVLNTLADWCEGSEAWLLSFIVQFYTNQIPSDIYVSYNRDYVLNTPEELLDVVHLMKKNYDPPNVITALTIQYIKAAYKNNPNKQVIEIKKYLAYPIPNESAASIEASEYVADRDKIAARYYTQWATTMSESEWLTQDVTQLRESLYKYCLTIKIEDQNEGTETEESD
jgi:hypothetical protein